MDPERLKIAIIRALIVQNPNFVDGGGGDFPDDSHLRQVTEVAIEYTIKIDRLTLDIITELKVV